MYNIYMKETFVCLITGPAGAGKSSVSKALAEKFERSAVIEVDTLRHMIKGGYVRPFPAMRKLICNFLSSAKNACDVASNLLEKDFTVFIDGCCWKKIVETVFKLF
jgi:deoxyadenosine/deoxycytidine kinase